MSNSEKKQDNFLNSLVVCGDIKSYEYEKVYDEPGRDVRTTERLILVFPSGASITLDTFCSGVMENTALLIDGKVG